MYRYCSPRKVLFIKYIAYINLNQGVIQNYVKNFEEEIVISLLHKTIATNNTLYAMILGCLADNPVCLSDPGRGLSVVTSESRTTGNQSICLEYIFI